MRDRIENEIQEAREKVARLDLDRAKLISRIETLEEMLEIIPEIKDPPKRRRKRSLSESWQNVLYLMANEKPEGATYDDIFDFVTRVGLDIKKSNLRGHMGNYKSSGYVKAVSDGLFVVTAEGKKQTKAPADTADSAKAIDDGNTDSQVEPSHALGSAALMANEVGFKLDPDDDDEIPF